MVLVDIRQEEVKALDALYAGANLKGTDGIRTGTVLGLFRAKIQEAFLKDREKQLKGKYAEKKKNKSE